MNRFVVIDTNAYAGNFARELVHYLTGRVGECETKFEVEFDESKVYRNPVDVVEDGGGFMSCQICPTPGIFNNGLGGHFPDTEQGLTDALEDHRQRCKIIGKPVTVMSKYPVYQSVEIAFLDEVTTIEAEGLMERALEFANLFNGSSRYPSELEIMSLTVNDKSSV